MKEAAVNKINSSKGEVKHSWMSDLIEPISIYLLGRLENDNDDELATWVVQEHKTYQKCINFVADQCHKHLNGKPGQISDNEVYLMAIDYFRADDAELERQKKAAEAVDAENRAKRNEESRILAEEHKAKSEADKQVEASKKAAGKKMVDGQLGLFD